MPFFYRILGLPAVLLLSLSSVSQNLSSNPGAGTKVCVAGVNNLTSQSLLVERLTKQLARSLSEKKITAFAMESSTTSDRQLHPTVDNGEELKRNDCDYLVLTQVSEPKLHPMEPRSPEITIGSRAPSLDAGDPSGAPARDNLEVNFAVFRPGNLKPLLDAQILDRPSTNVADSMMQAMDHEANRIRHQLKKK